MTTDQAARQAWLDWAQVGEFNSSKFTGDAKRAYEDESAKIQRQWDNQGE